jgi:Holliday junction DNA helicase RuvA
MIGFLSGIILAKRDSSNIIISVNNVGYVVSVASIENYEIGADVSLYIETIIKENSFSLFGFKTDNERLLFLKLLTVQGIGGKVGLSLLSLNNLEYLIKNEKLADIIKVNGVGKRMGERLIQELKDKVEVPNDNVRPQEKENFVLISCKQALKGLQYKKIDIDDAIKHIEDNYTKEDILNMNVQNVLRLTLDFLKQK